MKTLFFQILLFPLFFTLLQAKTIVIYHTSDVHGWYSSRAARWMPENPDRKIGGFPALAAMTKREKQPYILLDSGDLFQGTPEGTLTRGAASAELMNKLGYSAAAVGNHDYDYGEKNLLKNFIKKADFPLLGANVYYAKTGKPVSYLKSYIIVKKAGKKIAVLGLAGSHTSHSTLPSNVKHLIFKDEAEEARKWVKKIKQTEKPDLIICLLHNGLAIANGILDISTRTFSGKESENMPALRVARNAKGIDILLGGHIHTGYLKGYYDKPSKTLLTESYWGLSHVSRIKAEFDDKTGKFVGAKAELVPLWTDETGEDKNVLSALQKIEKKVSKEMDIVIGRSEGEIGTIKGSFDSPIGNWVTDIMKEYAKTDIAFQNTHGIRSTLPGGEIKIRNLFEVMPFDNTLVKMTMTGEQIKQLMRDNLRKDYSKMQVSGIKVKFKTDSNGNIEKLEIYRNGRPVKAGEKFSVVTNNYLSSGGSGGKAFTQSQDITNTMIPVRTMLIEWVKTRSPIKIPKTGRIVKLQ